MTQQKDQKTLPKQHQSIQPGIESKMRPMPESIDVQYRPAGKLTNKVAIITGGDSGIGRAVAFCYAMEGADLVIVYLNEHGDANVTKKLVQDIGRKCLAIAGDVGDHRFCQSVVDETIDAYGQLDILINNAAEQHVQQDFADITPEQLERTFRTNIYSYFFMTQAALPHLKEASVVIITTSITAYQGHEQLIDYASTKGAIVSFTRSLSSNLIKKGIRVNGVAPGPIWTPLIPASFPEEKVEKFGSNVPMKRPGQPEEVAPCFVFLASDDASYISGQVLHPNGGVVVNG